MIDYQDNTRAQGQIQDCFMGWGATIIIGNRNTC